MPAKDSSLKHGPRYNTISREVYDRYVEETKSTISYDSFKKIITQSLSTMREKMINNTTGIKMPQDMGYAIVTRFKPETPKRAIDWKKSKEYNTRVYFTDNTFGYKPRIHWTTSKMSKCKFISLYKFVPDRELSRGVGRAILAGKEYNEYTHDHFRDLNISVNLTKLSNG